MRRSMTAASAFLATVVLVLTGCVSASRCPQKVRVPTDHHPGWEQRLDQRITDLTGREEVRVVLFGDSGTAKSFEPVAREIARACAQQKCDFGLMLGDNFYIQPFRIGPRTSSSRHFESVFYTPLAGLGEGFDMWSVLGNHGYRGCPQAQIDHTYRDPRPGKPDWLMPAQVFAVPKLPDWLHVYAFDSEFVVNPRHFPGSEQDFEAARAKHLEGIAEALRDRQGWRVLVGHHPMYTTGHHAEDRELEDLRGLLRPIVEDLGVHIYLSGHDHDQELLRHGSLIQVVQGSGSRLRPQEIKPPASIPGGATSIGFWENPGFAIASFTRESLELEYFILDRATRQPQEPEKWTWRRVDLEDGEAGG